MKILVTGGSGYLGQATIRALLAHGHQAVAVVRSDAAARQADDGWSLTGESAVKMANHLRQAAEAAYAFSPAFRDVATRWRRRRWRQLAPRLRR